MTTPLGLPEPPDSLLISDYPKNLRESSATIDGILTQQNQKIDQAALDITNLKIGTVTTSAPGGNAAVTITGTYPNRLLNFTLPRGAEGPEDQPDAFTPLTLLNGWQEYTSFSNTVGVRKDRGRVELCGVVRNGTMAAAITTLPAAFRPTETRIVQGFYSGAVIDMRVNTDGTVTTVGTSTLAYLSLDQIAFYQ